MRVQIRAFPSKIPHTYPERINHQAGNHHSTFHIEALKQWDEWWLCNVEFFLVEMRETQYVLSNTR